MNRSAAASVPARAVRTGKPKGRKASLKRRTGAARRTASSYRRGEGRRSRRSRIAPPPSAESVLPEEPAARGYEEGYRDGVYAGGERLLEARLPPDILIPNLTLDEVVAAGVDALRPRAIPLLGTAAVYEELERMLEEKQPYALVRLGDGELLTMAQDTVLPSDEVRRQGYFLAYAGVDAPDLRARDELAASVRLASLVGVPQSRQPFFQPLLFAVWNAYGIRPETLKLTSSTVNYSLHEQGYLHRLMEGRRILVIGNVARELAQALASQGVSIAGTVSPVRGMSDLHRVVEEAASYDFDLALVSAGIAAVPICVHLVGRTGKAAIDFGHMANRIAGVGPIGRRG